MGKVDAGRAGAAEGRKRNCFDVLHWVWSCDKQGERLSQSEAELWKALGGSGSIPPRTFSTADLDAHLLLVAMRNLMLALDRVPDLRQAFPLAPEENERALRLLRDVYEHWDEYVDLHRARMPFPSRSGKSLTEEFPTYQPWSMSYGPEGTALAGLSLGDFFKALAELELAALAAWQEA